MGATFGQIAALLLSVAILLMGNGLQGVLLPLRAQVEDFSLFQIGTVGSAYFVGFAAGCYWGPRVIQRVGHIRAFAAMVAVASAAPLIHNIWVSPEIWWIMRGASGFCLAVLYMIIESWLNEKATNQNRGIIFSTYTFISLTVMTLGQMMINLSSIESFVLFSVASVLVSLAAVPLALTSATAPAPATTAKVRLGYLYRLSPVGVVGAFLIGGQQGAFWSLGPVFAERIGMSTFAITLFMSIVVIGGAAGQFPVGRLSDKHDRRKVLIGASLVAASIGLAIWLLYPTIGTGVLIFAFIYGAASFPLYSICAAHMNDHVTEGGFVEASSGMLLIYAGGAILGPMLVAPVMGWTSPYALFAGTAVCQAALAAFAFYRISKREMIPADQRSEFKEALTTIQTVLKVGEMEPKTLPSSPSQPVPDADAQTPAASEAGKPEGDPKP